MLTDLQIEKLAKPSARREIPDGRIGGPYLVVQPSGAKSWALRYRVAGSPKKFTVGPYPSIGLAAARKRAQKALAEVVDGVDPSAQKKAAREADKAANSIAYRVETVVDAYVKDYLGKKAKPSWAKEAERLLRVEVVPKFGKKHLGDLTDDDIHKLLKEIAERAPITVNRTFAVFRKLCHWTMSRDGGKLIKASPCDGVEMPTAERPRDRVLDDAEIKLAWQAFESIGWPFGPPKRGRDGKVRPALVFSTTGATAVSGFSRAKEVIDAAIVERLREEAEGRGEDPEEIKSPDWVIHDLWRTVAANLQKLGVRLEVTEAVLNHVSGSRARIVGIYQRHEWATEKPQALDVWARRLDAIVSGKMATDGADKRESSAGRSGHGRSRGWLFLPRRHHSLVGLLSTPHVVGLA